MKPPPVDRLPPLAVAFGACCWIALQLAARPAPLGTASRPAAAVDPAPPAVADTTDYLQMARWHLFREEPQGERKREATAAALPPTPLRLTLQGVVLLPGGHSVAIIRDPTGKERAYGEGDPLPGDAELQRIQARRVLLRRSGRLETLALSRAAASPATGMAQRGTGARRVVSVVPRRDADGPRP